jgi:hypothetical protein
MSGLSMGIPNSPRGKNKSPGLSLQERILLHQLHPLKLAVDWGTGFLAAWLLWGHDLVAALIVGFVPSILLSVYFILRTDLSRFKETPLGRYMLSPRTRPSDSLRLFGLVIMWGGAWLNNIPGAVAGLAIILLAWARGLFVKKKGEKPSRGNPFPSP